MKSLSLSSLPLPNTNDNEKVVVDEEQPSTPRPDGEMADITSPSTPRTLAASGGSVAGSANGHSHELKLSTLVEYVTEHAQGHELILVEHPQGVVDTIHQLLQISGLHQSITQHNWQPNEFCILSQLLLLYSTWDNSIADTTTIRNIVGDVLIETSDSWLPPLLSNVDNHPQVVTLLGAIVHSLPSQLVEKHVDFILSMVSILCNHIESKEYARMLLLFENMLLQALRIPSWQPVLVPIHQMFDDVFWDKLWTHCASADDDGSSVTCILEWTKVVLVTAPSLTPQLLKLVLIQHCEDICDTLRQPKSLQSVVAATTLILSFAACKHIIITESLLSSSLVDCILFNTMVRFPSSSIVHQLVYRIVTCVIESMPEDPQTDATLMNGNIGGFLLQTLLSVPKGSSSYAFTLKMLFAVSQVKDANILAKLTGNEEERKQWEAQSRKYVKQYLDDQPDAEVVADLKASVVSANAPVLPSGPVTCAVCETVLTAYYTVGDQQYCSDHRPLQCSVCRCAILQGTDYIQIGMLRYCSKHAPPQCIQCSKYVARYYNTDAGILCIDCGAPKCEACNLPVEANCVSFNGRRFHSKCFICSTCSCELSGPFLLLGDTPLCQDCGAKHQQKSE